MIRILLSLAVAAAAYFGPWMVNAGGMAGTDLSLLVDGQYFAASTVNCLLDMNFSISGDCAPQGDLLGKAITAAVVGGVAAAVVSILGLLPFVGRITSIFTLLSGVLAVAATGLLAYCLMTGDGSEIMDMRWGAYATGGFGLLTLFAGWGGMRGGE